MHPTGQKLMNIVMLYKQYAHLDDFQTWLVSPPSPILPRYEAVFSVCGSGWGWFWDWG